MTYPLGSEIKDTDMETTGDSDVFERDELASSEGQPSAISQLLTKELPKAKSEKTPKKPAKGDLLPLAAISKLHKRMKEVMDDASPHLG